MSSSQPRMQQYSVEVVGARNIPGEGKPRRNALCPDKLIVHPTGATTLYENFLHGVKEAGKVTKFKSLYSILLKHSILIIIVIELIIIGDGNFLGHREIKDGIAGPYIWQSYNQVQKRVANFGSGLKKMGSNLLGFFSINTPEYVKYFLLSLLLFYDEF